MLRLRFFLILLILLPFIFPSVARAQENLPAPKVEESYAKAQVKDIVDEGQRDIAGLKQFFQTVKLTLLDGKEKDKTITVDYTINTQTINIQRVDVDDTVVIKKTTVGNREPTYTITDKYRLPVIGYLIVGFFVIVFLAAGKKGLGAIIGMVVSVTILLKFIVPALLAGQNPVFVIILGSFVILLFTIFLAHGFSKQTIVAFLATTLTLLTTIILASISVSIGKLTGLGNEDLYMLQFGLKQINVQGLLLGSMIIGTLGILDDITTAQSATIFTIVETDRKLPIKIVMSKGFRIGKEHIASLVNTLILVYAGASLGLFILFVLNPTHQPYWVILNSEIIIEEVIRTLVGSVSLILAVPITTVLAAYIAVKTNREE